VRTVRIDIIPYRMTVFPIGSLHVMQNNGKCSTFRLDL
jgi:hypothetical protein